jgi:hypothetical protein
MTTDARSVRVPEGCALTDDEILVALTRLAAAKAHGWADVSFSFDKGRMVRRGWLMLKDGREETPDRVTFGGPA